MARHLWEGGPNFMNGTEGDLGMSFHQERKNGNSILKSSARIAAKLNYLSPQLFPAPDSTSNSVDIVAAENLLS
ncbi:hypothetical protein HPP92_023818 [Vanilla planifolia]|uniref:Uncharacterized protein n=1 Tax=Vanilla planifolia TaxID=51239 RepID=A0A835UCP9_VANPL|nr:hypothetical protein HPP92_023818 [Vanilla planifolia]